MKSPKRLAGTRALIGGVRQALAPLAGSGRSMIGVVAVGLLLVILSAVGWAKWGGAIRLRSKYVLTAESLEITPQPAWIHTDIRAEVVRDASLTAMSILDPDLTKRVVRAFELNTWVAEVTWAGKRPGPSGPQVRVELRYREPVIMVRTRDPRWEGDCFWPVDTEGVFLQPLDFSASQTRNYLRVEAGNSLPTGAVGTAYGDPAVVGAAAIASLLRQLWKPMGLEWIVVYREPSPQLVRTGDPTYLLLPTGTPSDAVSQLGRVPPTRLTGSTGGAPAVLEVPHGDMPRVWNPRVKPPRRRKSPDSRPYVEQHGRLDELPATTIIDLRPNPQSRSSRPDTRLNRLPFGNHHSYGRCSPRGRCSASL